PGGALPPTIAGDAPAAPGGRWNCSAAGAARPAPGFSNGADTQGRKQPAMADTTTRRVVSLWLPRFATDRLARRLAAAPRPRADWRSRPLATVTDNNGGGRGIAAVNRAAEVAGVRPGLPLADARALAPAFHAADADPVADRRALDGLAAWCGRYAPWTAADGDGPGGHGGAGGIWLDVGGAAHLLGGEEALLEDLTGRVCGLGFHCAAALADTPGAAWAVARFATNGNGDLVIVPAGGAARALAPLPVAALRLPAAVVEGLGRMGLRHAGDLTALPRGPLTRRFGGLVVRRLDQALGRTPEPLFPRSPAAPVRVRLAFAEPVGRRDDIASATRRLIGAVCDRLAEAHRGARRLELALYRVDGTVAGAAVGTSRPVRDADHLERLFADKLDRLDAGFGVEVMTLAVAAADPLPPAQAVLDAGPEAPAADALARLIDRLGNRLGRKRILGLKPRASHLPERACRAVPFMGAAEAAGARPAAGNAGKSPDRPRPLHLLPWPEPIEAMAPVPDHAPVMFRWRRRQYRVARADGPERIAPEWWREAPEDLRSGGERTRDYYRIEDEAGGRFWVFREGPYRPGVAPRWYLHGVFP
ncbi:MAG: hypothetical protein ACE5GT_05045, partial [Rhodospirillales bacterium]